MTDDALDAARFALLQPQDFLPWEPSPRARCFVLPYPVVPQADGPALPGLRVL